jgi:two-component system response regulator NreC
MSRLRILLADDHTILRQGLVSILKAAGEFEVVAEAADGSEALAKALETRPDVVVLDLTMPRLNGLEAARRIHKALPRARILVLTMHDDEEYVLKTVRAGASGYLVKDGAASELVAALRALGSGRGYFGPQASNALAKGYQADEPVAEDPYSRLTDREREVFQLLVEGCTNARVANILCISAKTVDNHRTHLMEKLGLHSTVELLRFAAKHGHLS